MVQLVVAVSQVVTAPQARVTGTLDNSTTLGTWGVVSFAILGASLVDRRRWWRLPGTASSLALVVLSASQGGASGHGRGSRRRGCRSVGPARKAGWWWPLGALLALVVGVLLLPTSRARLTGGTPFAEATITGRLLLWRETLTMVASQPLLGVGPSRFVDAIGIAHDATWADLVGPYAPPDSPHNVVLQVIAATGAVGLVACVAVLVIVWRDVRTRQGWTPWTLGVTAASSAPPSPTRSPSPIRSPRACVAWPSDRRSVDQWHPGDARHSPAGERPPPWPSWPSEVPMPRASRSLNTPTARPSPKDSRRVPS